MFKNKEKKIIAALSKLTNNVFQCTFCVAEAITTSLKSKEKQLTEEQDYGIKKEILCFYLHYSDRIAIQGGNEYYAWLQDNMVVTCSELLVNMLFHAKNETADFEEWKNRMVNQCVDLYNKRGQEYVPLGLTSDSGFPKDDTVFGKLMLYVNQIIGMEKMDNLNMMVEMPLWIMQSATNYKLADQVRGLKKLVC